MASLPLSCTLAPSSNLKQSHRIVPNRTSSLFNLVSYTHKNKPNTHFNGFRVSAKANDDTVQLREHKMITRSQAQRLKVEEAKIAQEAWVEKYKEEIAKEVEKAREKIYEEIAKEVEAAKIAEEPWAEKYKEEIAKVVEAAKKAEEAKGANEVKKVRETRSVNWGMALDTLLSQINSIRRKIELHFLDDIDSARPMLKILKDVKHLVQTHKDKGKDGNHIPTTDAMLNIAKNFQDYRSSTRKDGVIPVDPKPKRNAFSPMIDMFTEVANLLYGQRGVPIFLQGKFVPVDETRPTEINVETMVEGTLPSCIEGMFIRNGPNPQFKPLAKYQLVDGDGMLHATNFKKGKITYTARYVQTSRFKQEQKIGQAEFAKYGDYTGAFGVFSAFTQLLKSMFMLDTSYGCGVANENVVYHNGLLLVLEDFDRPYAIKVRENGDIDTLGLYDFNNNLSHNCTPHIKKDPKTGEMFVIGGAYTKPYMTYRVVSDKGDISKPVPIEVSGPTYMHDFCITEKYLIVMDLPFTFNPEAMLKNNDWIYNLDMSKPSRFGIRPRDPEDDTTPIKWFEFKEPFQIYHNANAWEDGNTVVLYGFKYEPTKGEDGKVAVVKSLFQSTAVVGEYVQLSLPTLYKFTFDMDTGEATQEEVAGNLGEYPAINEKYWARKSRYVYSSEFVLDAKNAVKNHAIVKYDLEAEPGQRVKRGVYGENIVGSEAVFIPSSKNATEEDDGYLLSYVHDEAKGGKSYVYVMCAKEMKKVATVELPNRVPYGFHAIFVNEDELLKHQNAIDEL